MVVARPDSGAAQPAGAGDTDHPSRSCPRLLGPTRDLVERRSLRGLASRWRTGCARTLVTHSVRRTTRAKLGIAPSTVSTAVGQLAAAGLVDDDGAGVFPELFWELAARWRPQRQWLAAVPPTDGVVDRYEGRHWRRTGTGAAAFWGAPIAAGPDQVVELYVPGPAEMNTAARRFGVVPAGTGPAVVSVAADVPDPS